MHGYWIKWFLTKRCGPIHCSCHCLPHVNCFPSVHWVHIDHWLPHVPHVLPLTSLYPAHWLYHTHWLHHVHCSPYIHCLPPAHCLHIVHWLHHDHRLHPTKCFHPARCLDHVDCLHIVNCFSLCKWVWASKPSNFVSLSWTLDNPYCHSFHHYIDLMQSREHSTQMRPALGPQLSHLLLGPVKKWNTVDTIQD